MSSPALTGRFSPRQRLYATARYSRLVQYSNQLFGTSNPAYGDILTRLNLGATLGEIITLTPSLTADIRLNYGRFSQPEVTNGDGFHAATLGLPNLPSARPIFPRFTFNSGSLNPLGSTAQTPGTAPFNTNDGFLDIIKTVYRQTLKFGVDFRKVQRGDQIFGNASGLYNFDNNFTGAFGTDTFAAVGSDTAAFLLGLPSSASYDLNVPAVGNQTYLGLFAQDDWRVRPRLSLNFGLRMDDDFSPNEREDAVVNGFNTTATNPYSAAATAAYAAHPNAMLAPANFKVNGGLTFAGPGGKFSNFPSIMLSPRIGLAYRPHMFGQNTVIRTGFGIFVIPIFPFNNPINQEGFSQTTQSPIVSYAPPTAGGPGTLSNPFPNGLTPASGSSAGLGTFVGQPLTFLNPSIRNGYVERWHLGVQHQCFKGWLVEAFYEGSTGRRLAINEQLNYVQPQYLHGRVQSGTERLGRQPVLWNPARRRQPELQQDRRADATAADLSRVRRHHRAERRRGQLHLPLPRPPHGTSHRLWALDPGELSVVQGAGGRHLPERLRPAPGVPHLPVRPSHCTRSSPSAMSCPTAAAASSAPASQRGSICPSAAGTSPPRGSSSAVRRSPSAT
jgi:hypothetical protein